MTVYNGKQGRRRAVVLPPWPFKRGTTGSKVSFS